MESNKHLMLPLTYHTPKYLKGTIWLKSYVTWHSTKLGRTLFSRKDLKVQDEPLQDPIQPAHPPLSFPLDY